MAVTIIICSRSSENLHRSTSVIRKTIGLDFEILSSLHSSKLGLSQSYNQLAIQAKYDYLIFMHDDLIFHTMNWGKLVLNLLINKSIGLVGLMGACYKSSYTSIWTACDYSLYRNSKETDTNDYSDVVVVDGCFLAMRKNTLISHQFDTKLSGFHGYDLDISLNILRSLKVVVANKISFEHLSNGVKDIKWFDDTSYVHNKWESILPARVGHTTDYSTKFSDYLSLKDQFNSIRHFQKNNSLLFAIYIKMIFKYFRFNKLRHSRIFVKSLFR